MVDDQDTSAWVSVSFHTCSPGYCCTKGHKTVVCVCACACVCEATTKTLFIHTAICIRNIPSSIVPHSVLTLYVGEWCVSTVEIQLNTIWSSMSTCANTTTTSYFQHLVAALLILQFLCPLWNNCTNHDVFRFSFQISTESGPLS